MKSYGYQGADGPCRLHRSYGSYGAYATIFVDCGDNAFHCAVRPLRFRPVRPVPPARGATPGHRPQRGCTPCQGSSQMRFRQRPSNAHEEEGPVLKHRGTEEHRGVVLSQTHRAKGRPNPSEFTSESAGPAQSRAPRSPLLHTLFTPNTQRLAESCPDRA